MADHWKSIANRLGAPGVDEPEAEAQAAEQVAAPAAKREPSPPARSATPQRSKSSASEPAVDRRGAPTADLKSDSPGSEPASVESREDVDTASELGFDPNLPIPDEALSFKSTRPKPARKESQSEPKTQTQPPAARSFSEPPTDVAPEARREAPRMPDRVEPTATPAAASPPDKPNKRKSSWESLANMFNIKVDRSKPVEADVAESPRPESKADISSERSAPASGRDRPARRGTSRSDEDQQLSIFSGEQTDEPNAALKSMFGDAPPAKDDSWGKPRMVDDLGWDDDDQPESKASLQSAESSDEEESGDEPARRGRRRRRGRRGRGDAAAESQPPASEKTSRWGGLDEADEAASLDDEWPEPDSFESADSGSSAREVDLDLESDFDAVEIDAADIDDDASEGEPERRSSRRRRRGRGRGRDREQADATEPAPAKRPAQRPRGAPAARVEDDTEEAGFVSEVGFVSDVDDDEDFDADAIGTEPRRDEVRRDVSSDDERGGTRGRRRRRGRGSSEEGRPDKAGPRSRSSREPQRAAAGPPEDDDGLDSELEPMEGFDADDDDLGEDGKHRSIPTWADSIQSLVTANMENRKRGDNRSAPRGRPRGRR